MFKLVGYLLVMKEIVYNLSDQCDVVVNDIYD